MNMKENLEKDFLRLQKILRELRYLRFNNMTHKSNRATIEEAIRILGPMSDKMKEKLDTMTRPTGDYDL